jgi:hypothetical protein
MKMSGKLPFSKESASKFFVPREFTGLMRAKKALPIMFVDPVTENIVQGFISVETAAEVTSALIPQYEIQEMVSSKEVQDRIPPRKPKKGDKKSGGIPTEIDTITVNDAPSAQDRRINRLKRHWQDQLELLEKDLVALEYNQAILDQFPGADPELIEGNPNGQAISVLRLGRDKLLEQNLTLQRLYQWKGEEFDANRARLMNAYDMIKAEDSELTELSHYDFLGDHCLGVFCCPPKYFNKAIKIEILRYLVEHPDTQLTNFNVQSFLELMEQK